VSLIDEALKKVSEEAARRDALSQGAPIPYAASRGAERKRFKRGFGIGIGAGLLIAALALVAVLARPQARRTLPAPVRATARTSAPVPITEEVIVPPPPGTKAPSPRRAPVRATAERKTAAPPKTPAVPESGRSYPAKLDLPDGQTIELDGIVYSDTKPVALVNGHVLVAGDFVLDFRLVKIERDHISLEGRGATFTMTMH
jgi:hypothetical protein